MRDLYESNAFGWLNTQISELKEDIRKLDQKIDTVLKLCYETSMEVKVLTEVKNTLRRDVDKLTSGAEVLVSDQQERTGMIKTVKTLFTFRNAIIFFVGFVFATAQQTNGSQKKSLEVEQLDQNKISSN